MKFTKMQGIGNDYVYVNCLKEKIGDPAKIAQFVSDRHFGIGSDGLILIKPSQTADFSMEIYNADGSKAEMCGNGIRCVGKYVYDYGLTDKKKLTIETGSGIKHLQLFLKNGKADKIKADIGSPILKAAYIPVVTEAGKTELINEPICVNGKVYNITCVSMGNPHAVVFMDQIKDLKLEQIGSFFENHEIFPNRINTEFVRIIDRQNIEMRVWERGSGETLACGTGACASVVAAILNGYTDHRVNVKLLGGDLEIEWDREVDTVYMTGMAAVVFDGEIDQ